MAVSMASVVRASRDQLSCDLGGEMAVLNTRSGCYYGLDGAGPRIWGLLQEPRTVAAIRDALLGEYEVGAAQCEAELIGLLEKLAEAGLIEVRAEADR